MAVVKFVVTVFRTEINKDNIGHIDIRKLPNASLAIIGLTRKSKDSIQTQNFLKIRSLLSHQQFITRTINELDE